MRLGCREILLDAAQTVVVREGAAKMTLDAVAAEANVSKGGLLYHFHTKEALLEGMIARHVERVRARRREALASLPAGANAELQAELRAALMRTETDTRVGSALLAAVANDPKLLESVAAYQRERFGRLKNGASEEEFARRALVLLATEGLVFFDLLGLAPFDESERKALSAALLLMAAGKRERVPRSRKEQ